MTDIISSIASNVIINLGSSALEEAASVWHFKPELQRLTNTVTTIRDVLLAHEDSQVHGLESLIERLKDAVHDTDDLLDKFTTLTERKRLMISSSRGRFTKEVQLFFSRDNQVSTAIKISREIKRIRKTLDDIVGDREKFGSMFPLKDPEARFGVDKRRETCSFVVPEDVIGRDDDKKKIIDILLSHDHPDDPRTARVLVLPIVGVGGLGKTTIAQFVFNDEGVKTHFHIMKWVCIGDEVRGVKNIIKRIVSSAEDHQSLQHIQENFREEMERKRYLIVLDDVWEENPIQLLELRSLLSVGENGSAVIVTTRSTFIAQKIETIPHMNLKYLSDEASWKLFAKVAFEDGQQQDQHLVQIGKEILKKCGNLPLAIKVVASLLRGEDEKKWRYFKDHDLANIDVATDIMPILKLSYSHLRSQLKQCFIYCSLFPKDREINKIELCHHWMAQGFITSSSSQKNSEECLEDAAEQCFMELLHRSFFQDIRRDKWGEIVRFKMHDLVHDLALEVARKETLIVDGGDVQIGLVTAGTRYLSISKAYSTPNLPSSLHGGGNNLRTFLQRPTYEITHPPSWELSDLFSCFQCIKVLDLRELKIKELPDSIGRLIHLRYLDLSSNSDLELLPRSFTRLHNLETLKLTFCLKLKELPRDFSKLVNLQSLDIRCCQLSYMPPGMGNLTRLWRLTDFVLGVGKFVGTKCHFKPHNISASGMDDLLLLRNLRGSLNIVIKRMEINDSMSIIATKAGCLLNKMDLKDVEIRFHSYEGADASQEEQLLGSLQPHSNLRSLFISGYGAENFPSWLPMNDLSLVLPNLVSINFDFCQRCQHLPILSQLPSLKWLYLQGLSNLEYIESNYSYEASTSVTFFPSLEGLCLSGLQNVKGWWTPEISGTTGLGCDSQHSEQRLLVTSFPLLSKLAIIGCPNMTTMPLCPSVEELNLFDFSEKLCLTVMETDEQNSAAPLLNPTSSSSTAMSSSSTPSQLAKLSTDNINYLHQLPKSCLHSLVRLKIAKSKDATLLSGSFWQHLTSLEDLNFFNCDAHDHQDKEETDEISWRSLRRLRHLSFDRLPNLTTLPKGIRYLTNLQYLLIQQCYNLVEVPGWISELSSSLQGLIIHSCPELKALPEGIRDLTSLRYLSLHRCPNLVERCRKPTGEDWPKIRHVPWIQLPDGDEVRINDNSV